MLLVHIQWATRRAQGYETHRAEDWESAPKKNTHIVDNSPGLIAHVVVLGQMLSEDHISVQLLSDGRLCLCGWGDNVMPDGSSAVQQIFLSEEIVETVLHSSANITQTIRGPRTTKRVYCNENLWSKTPIYTNPGVVEFLPLDEFVEPPDRTVKHGVLLSDNLWAEHCVFDPPDDVLE